MDARTRTGPVPGWWLSLVVVAMLAALTGCRKDEPLIKIKQRSEATIAPGITLNVGDIRMDGVATLRIVSGGAELARTEARVGDVIPFNGGGQRGAVEVVRFENHVTHEDYAYFRVRH